MSKITLEDIEKQLEMKKIKWIEGEFKNNYSKITIQDEEGYKGVQTISSLMNNSKLMKFSKNNPFVKENITLWAKNNYKYKIVEFEEYLGAEEKNITCYCEKHGNFKRSWNQIRNNTNCPHCYKEMKRELFLGENNIRYSSKIIKCKQCGKEFFRTESQIKQNGQNFCCKKCFDLWRSENLSGKNSPFWDREIVKCCQCGIEFEITHFAKNRNNNYYCSQDCYSKWRSENIRGENSPSWKPELTQEERENRRCGIGIPQWRQEVYERDNYTCQCCGDDRGGNLNAHHLNGYNWDKEHRTDIDNGVTLCNKCHKKFHDEYGYGNNTKEQFEEFLKRNQE